jgi:hypothetical protein
MPGGRNWRAPLKRDGGLQNLQDPSRLEPRDGPGLHATDAPDLHLADAPDLHLADAPDLHFADAPDLHLADAPDLVLTSAAISERPAAKEPEPVHFRVPPFVAAMTTDLVDASGSLEEALSGQQEDRTFAR